MAKLLTKVLKVIGILFLIFVILIGLLIGTLYASWSKTEGWMDFSFDNAQPVIIELNDSDLEKIEGKNEYYKDALLKSENQVITKNGNTSFVEVLNTEDVSMYAQYYKNKEIEISEIGTIVDGEIKTQCLFSDTIKENTTSDEKNDIVMAVRTTKSDVPRSCVTKMESDAISIIGVSDPLDYIQTVFDNVAKSFYLDDAKRIEYVGTNKNIDKIKIYSVTNEKEDYAIYYIDGKRNKLMQVEFYDDNVNNVTIAFFDIDEDKINIINEKDIKGNVIKNLGGLILTTLYLPN